ncbi:unnamed protein product [Macrosiphum euphorbiae]|uniref:Uncharacterized protein n=1 Tax=Macrosiphum euphorbiae TaxID=13131 RepID=A0AAV0W8M9_9HEMI|nr:unnamed protein product [Macrosiphum euphorbiae]
MTKVQRMLNGESAMKHAIILTGVNVNNGNATNWRVENSWSEERHEKGYLMMTTDLFQEFVLEVVVDKSLLSEEVLSVFQQESQVLPVWNPIGTLA